MDRTILNSRNSRGWRKAIKKVMPAVRGSTQPILGTQRGTGCVRNQSRWPTELECEPENWEGATGLSNSVGPFCSWEDGGPASVQGPPVHPREDPAPAPFLPSCIPAGPPESDVAQKQSQGHRRCWRDCLPTARTSGTFW